jgi:hypothetical protein
MTVAQQERVMAILRAAGLAESDVVWMTASCPDAELAERYYGRGRSLYLAQEGRS